MRRETLQERKRFAADLAERDAQSSSVGRGRAKREPAPNKPDRCPRAHPLVATRCDEKGKQAGRSGSAHSTAATPTAEVLERYRMRRWWLDRYSLDEIRELATGLVHLERAA